MKRDIFKFSLLILLSFYLMYYYYFNEYHPIRSLGALLLALAGIIQLFVKLKKHSNK